MRRIMIPTLKRIGTCDCDGVICPKEVFDNYIANHHDPVAVVIENSIDTAFLRKSTIDRTIGYTSVINDKYIIADLSDCNDKKEAAIINKAVDMINEGKIKVFMNFTADLDQTHTHVKEMHSIAYFHLCNNAGEAVIAADLIKALKKEHRKHKA